MNDEEKKMLEETLAIVKENNQMLTKVRRVQKQGYYSRILYYLIIIGIAVGAFYFLQPYVEKIESIWQETNTAFNKIKNVLPKQQ